MAGPLSFNVSSLVEISHMNEKIYFNSIKEKGDDFYVEYSPPQPDVPFASLKITYVEDVSLEIACLELEAQSKKWIKRYPVAVMATVFDFSSIL